MTGVHRFSFALVGAGAFSAIAIGACREPTTILLELRTDVPCSSFDRASIYVGAPGTIGGSLAGLASAAETVSCTPDPVTGTSSLGSITIAPTDREAPLALRVVGRYKTSNCNANLASGCIDARRTLGFVHYRQLALPILLSDRCRDVTTCTPDQTCEQGTCVDSTIDPESCVATGTCPTPGDGGVVDARPDVVTGTCAPLLDIATYLWHFDETSGATVEEAISKIKTTLNSAAQLGQGSPGCGNGLVLTTADAGLAAQLISTTTAPSLTSPQFKLAFRLMTTSTDLTVSVLDANKGGWVVGLANGRLAASLCAAGNQCKPAQGNRLLNDGKWHTYLFQLTASGLTATIDGALEPNFTILPFAIAPSGFLVIKGNGTIDELTFQGN